MSEPNRRRSDPEIVSEERQRFLQALPPPDAAWPVDVRLVYREVNRCVLDEGVTAQEIVADCGLRSHDVYTRFKTYTGTGIRERIVALRLELAQRLLRVSDVSVSQIAYAVGYRTAGGFSTTFKRHVGCTPSELRKDDKNSSH